MSRIAVCAVLFAASCLFVVQRAAPVGAQDKKDKKDNTALLEKQVASLRQDLTQAVTAIVALRQDNAQGAQQIVALKAANAKLQAENQQLTAAVKKGKDEDTKDDKTIKGLQTTIDGFRGAGLVHVVILKLKADSPATEVQSLIDDTYTNLSKIKTVRGLWAGKPAPTDKGTPDAATDFAVALVFVFDDAAGLKAYLKDPIHDKFADVHLSKWETPLVYDFEPKKVKR